jgi:O-antigen/teichoic acid export membrane protein
MSDVDSSLKTFAKGAGLVFMAIVLSKGFNYIYRVAVARYLGTSGYGLIAIALGIEGIILSFIFLGLKTGIVRYTAFYRGKHDDKRVKGTIVSAIDMLLPLSLAAGFLLFTFAPDIARIVLSENNLAPQLALILQIFALSIPFHSILLVFKAASRGFQNVKYFVYGEHIIYSILQMASVLVFLYFGFGIMGAAAPHTLGIMAAAIIMFLLFKRRLFPNFRSVKALKNHSELFWYSIPLIVAEISGIIMGWLDTIFLGFFKTASETGIYNAAVPTANIIYSMSSIFGVLFFPIVTGYFAKKKYKEMHRTYKVISKWAFSVSFPFLLLMLLFSKNILYIFFGPEYASGALSLSILATGYFFSIFFLTSAHILVAIKKTRWVAVNFMISAIINVTLNYVLIPVYGMIGAAVATTISVITLHSLYAVEAYHSTKSIGIKFVPFSWGMFKAFVSGIMSLSIIFMIAQLWEYVPIYVMGVLFLLFLLLYSIFILLLRGLDREDILILKSMESKIGIEIKWLKRIIRKFMR